MGEENPQVSPKAAYNRAVRAEEKAENALNEIASLKSSIDELVRTLKGAPSQIQAQSLRPGQMIHTIISEDDEGITEEIVCPTCGTRELRKIPAKIEVKEKPVVPENYIPAPTRYRRPSHCLSRYTYQMVGLSSRAISSGLS